ncbi:MAG: Alkyl hydroperoxide reductase C [Myxococcota bacterium]|nr:Alkyl hydroperoxide reductase C [Myxococcota bacterium]
MSTPLVGSKVAPFTLEGVHKKEIKNYTLPLTNGKYTVLLFYPLDFTFVCPTEILAYSDAHAEFEKAGAQVFGISVDSKYTHLAYTETSRKAGGVGEINFPLLADLNKDVARQFGVLSGAVALRGLFIIDEEGVVQHATINNLSVGRNPQETVRLVQAFQHTKKTGDVCPANWTPGADTMKPNPQGLKDYAAKH